jgi:hypothetical protein
VSDTLLFTKAVSLPDGLVCACLSVAARMEHVMKFSKLRALESLFTLLTAGVRRVLDYNRSAKSMSIPSQHR